MSMIEEDMDGNWPLMVRHYQKGRDEQSRYYQGQLYAQLEVIMRIQGYHTLDILDMIDCLGDMKVGYKFYDFNLMFPEEGQ